MIKVSTIGQDTLHVDYTGDGSRTATIHRTGRVIIAGHGAGLLDRVILDHTFTELNDGINRVLRDMRKLGLFLDPAQTKTVFGF